LISLSSPAGSATFKYDAMGRRTEKTVNGQTTGFLYDGAQAIAEMRGGSIDTVYHTGVAIDEVLARYGSSGNKTLLTDALMSVIAQANDSQSVDNFYAYSAYGEATALGPDGGNSLQYTGRENDGTGQQFSRARYYDHQLKRWISEDPIRLQAGQNFYAYVGGDPVNQSDPTGEIATSIGGALTGAILDIGIQLAFNGGRIECVKWDVVVIAAIIGAVNPFSGLNAARSAIKAERQFARSGSLPAGSRVAKRASQRGYRHNSRSMKEFGGWTGVEGVSEGVGNLIPDERHFRIADPCECQSPP